MLSAKDLEKIRDIVDEIVKDRLTVKEITVERLDLPSGKIERKTVDIYIPEWIAAELPNLSGALRGMQETVDHAKNNSFKVAVAINDAMNDFQEKVIDNIKALKHDDAEVLKIESST